MAAIMTSKFIKPEVEKVKFGKKTYRRWADYICTFKSKPTKKQLNEKKRKMRRYLLNGDKKNKGLLQLRNGERFEIRVKWTKDKNNPLKYHLIVYIRAKNDPPAESTPPPSPPPKGVGGM